MRRLLLVLGGLLSVNLAVILAGPGCGNTVIEIKNGDGGGGAGGGSGTTTTTTIDPDASTDGKDALPDYIDPGCPDAPPAMTDFQCDPYHQNNGDCAPGDGCYIYVQYPQEACEQEIYGAYCSPAGGGSQGDPCGGGPDCGAGLVCVITGFGTQCVQLCPLSGQAGCPDGLTCEAIDVEGFGGCF